MQTSTSRFFTILFVIIFINTILLGQTVTDYDGNVYNTVTIGSQTWLKENLKSLHYCDATEIPDVVAYNNLDSLAEIYGLLYTWDAAMKGTAEPGTQGVCPCEWHLPTSAEWAELENFLGGSSVAGGKMKDTTTGYWQSPNTGADNSSGFTGLPAGEYDANQGIFQLINQYAVFWTSTSVSTSKANERYLSYNNAASTPFDWYKTLKYSIRCIKDEVSDVKESGRNAKPDKFQLFQNYPNPFNPSTTIAYNLPEDSQVALKIYNSLGQKVKTLVNDFQTEGYKSVEWDGTDNFGNKLSSGTYIYQLQTDDKFMAAQNHKMVLLK